MAIPAELGLGGSLGSIEKETEGRKERRGGGEPQAMGTLISRRKIYALCEYRSSVKLDVGGVRATITTLQIHFKVQKLPTFLSYKKDSLLIGPRKAEA